MHESCDPLKIAIAHSPPPPHINSPGFYSTVESIKEGVWPGNVNFSKCMLELECSVVRSSNISLQVAIKYD